MSDSFFTTTPEILSAKSDYIFKLIFGDERNKDILKDFIKSFVSIGEEEYEILEITDPHLKRTAIDGKLAILDIKVKTKSGILVNIEIQLLNTMEIKERIVFYLSRLISDQIKIGDDYKTLRKSICIVITDFKFLSNEKYFGRFRFHDPKTNTEFSDIAEIITLELPKLPKESDGSEKHVWGRFLESKSMEELEMIEDTNVAVSKAAKILKILSQKEDVRAEYEAREKALRDYRMYMNDAFERGRIEEKLQTAKRALSQGISIEVTSQIIGLSIEQIKSLKEE